MKKMKKIFSLLVAMAMVLGMSASVFAATITVTQSTNDGTVGNESYVAYKIFDVTKTSEVTEDVTTDDTIGDVTAEGFAYTINANSAWVSVLGTWSDTDGWTSASDQSWVTLTKSASGDLYTVTWTGEETEDAAIEFADWLLEKVPTLASVDKKYVFDTEYGAVTVDDGYYLITSSLGTNLILATSNINITEKNEYIVDNKVAETASVTVGETATYYIEVHLPAGIDVEKPVIVHDTLADELSFNNDSVQVAVLDADPGSTATDYKAITTFGTLPREFVLSNGDEEENPCTFHITLNTDGYAGKYLVFKYTAELTSAADADGDGYVNNEYTTYSNYKTDPSTPVVKTYDFDFTKVDGEEAQLEGAVFELRTDGDDATTAIDFIRTNYYTNELYTETSTDSTDYKGAATSAKKADSDDTDKTTNLVAGDLNVSGLGAGTYYLVETIAPQGYTKLAEPFTVVIADDGSYTINGNNINVTGSSPDFKVVNQSGSVLPSTGGIGTTIFYVVGAILVIGAGVIMITRRRMDVQ